MRADTLHVGVCRQAPEHIANAVFKACGRPVPCLVLRMTTPCIRFQSMVPGMSRVISHAVTVRIGSWKPSAAEKRDSSSVSLLKKTVVKSLTMSASRAYEFAWSAHS